MNPLNEYYCSGNSEQVLLQTLEITASAWAAPILLCQGFEDQTAVTEDGRTLTFIASGMDVALPKSEGSARQELQFGLDNVSRAAQSLLTQAIDAQSEVTLTRRAYLWPDLSAPAEPPSIMTVLGATFDATAAQVKAGLLDLLNTAWPRLTYTLDRAPGIRYIND